uniref:Uncharacterized protein n=1 Tax=Rhizophora mucronata TaxID=61149 RepID=A0A2P2QA44_RHIMU
MCISIVLFIVCLTHESTDNALYLKILLTI